MIEKRHPFRSKAITQAAKDEPCTVCGRNDGTTVFCHLNESWAGKGMGQKADDIGMFLCFEHHEIYDGRRNGNLSDRDILRSLFMTIRRLIDKGVIKVA